MKRKRDWNWVKGELDWAWNGGEKALDHRRGGDRSNTRRGPAPPDSST